MASVPNKIREGAYGLGATKLEVATKVVLPAATSGIVASIVLAISRAIGDNGMHKRQVAHEQGFIKFNKFDSNNDWIYC